MESTTTHKITNICDHQRSKSFPFQLLM